MTLSTTIEQEFGYLALAVAQAGAYISRSECCLSHYLKMYKECRGELLEEYGDQAQKIDDYGWTAYTMQVISFEQLTPQASKFLKICTFLHHDGISEAIFQKAAGNLTTYIPTTNEDSKSLSMAKDFLNWFRMTEGIWDMQKFLKMIVEIRSYPLIDFDKANARTTLEGHVALKTFALGPSLLSAPPQIW